MRSLQTLVLTGAVTLGLVLTACDSGSGATVSSTGKPVDGQSFTMAVSADPGNLDPHFTSLSVTLQVDNFLYDSLVNLDPDGKMVAGLAEKWEGTTTKATYTLRKGVTCADGSPLTATTVAENISFVGDPAEQVDPYRRVRPGRGEGHRGRRGRHRHSDSGNTGRVPGPQRRWAAHRLRQGHEEPQHAQAGR